MGRFEKRRENNYRDRDSDRGESRGFGRSRGRDRGDDFGDREFKPHRPRDGPRRQLLDMHTVICDKCGRECEVPFKPTSNKPVYCRECFGKEGGDSGPRERNSGGNSEQFEKINRKLDKIMRALNLD